MWPELGVDLLLVTFLTTSKVSLDSILSTRAFERAGAEFI